MGDAGGRLIRHDRCPPTAWVREITRGGGRYYIPGFKSYNSLYEIHVQFRLKNTVIDCFRGNQSML